MSVALPAALCLGLMANGVQAQTTPAPAPQDSKPADGKPADKPADAPQDAQAPQIVIQGQKPANRIDRQVYDNTKNVDSATGTAADALNKVPSVNVDNDGNVTLRGNSNVQVYVDGKPSAQMSGDNRAAALQAMSSGDIQSVEVMTNPGAQYSSEGSGGIINLVTKKNRKPGGSGAITATVGSDSRYNGSFTGSYRKGKVTLSGGLNVRHDNRTAQLRSILQPLDSNGQPTSTTTSSGGGVGTIDNLSANAGIDYAADDKNSFGVQGNYSRRNLKTLGDGLYTTVGMTPGSFLRHTSGQSPHEDQMLDFSWNHTGDTEGETLKTDLRISRSLGDSDTANINTFTAPAPAPATVNDTRHASNDLRNGVLSVDYNRYVGADQLATGIQITYDDNHFINTANGGNTAGLTNDFAYTQVVSAAYVTYQKQFGDKWTVLGGLRAENLDLKTDLIIAGTTSHIDYTKLSPSFFATYTMSPAAKLRFSYSHRLRRPAPLDLNPFQTYVDPQNVTAGNPALKPQETDSYEAGYEYQKSIISYQVRGYYRKNTNSITSYSYFVTPGVLLTTKQNFGESQSGGIEANFSGPLSKKLLLNANTNLAYNEVDTAGLGGKQSGTTLSGRIGLTYKATAKDVMQFSYFSSGKQLTGQGYVAPFTMGNVSYRHTFNPKLALVLNVNDPFRTGRFETVTNSTTVHSQQIRTMQGQIIYLGLTYTFGGPATGPTPQQGPQGQRWGGPGGQGGAAGPNG